MTDSGAQASAPLVVEIFDQPFRLSSESADVQGITEAAAYLDGKMRDLAKRRGRGVALEVAILAAMEIADEMMEANQRRERLLAEADARIDRFTRSLADEDRTDGVAGSSQHDNAAPSDSD